MKKFTLLLCVFVVSVMMPQWAFAQSIDVTGTTLTVNSNVAGYLKNVDKTDAMKSCTKIVLVGKFNNEDLQSVNSGNGFTYVKEVDMTDAVFVNENNYTTYYYIASDNDAKPSNNIQEGDKCFVGGRLYKLNLSQSYEWKLTTFDSSIQYRVFGSYNQMMECLTEGSIKFAKIDVYRYYKVVKEKVWNDPVSSKPGSGQLKDFVNSPDDLPVDLSSYNENDYIGVVTAGNFYRLDYGKHWVEITYDDNAEEVTDQTPGFSNLYDTGSWPTTYAVGKRIKVKINNDDKSYELQEDPNNKSWTYINNTGEGISSYSTPTDITEDNKNGYTYNYTVGDVIRIVTNCNYYQIIWKKMWEEPSETGDNNAPIPSFSEAEIESHLNDYNENAQVKFFVRTDYYEHLDNSTREWIAYNETPQKVDYFFADDTERDANAASAKDWSIAVVGATKEYSYNNNEWTVPSSSSVEYDYSSISFTHWSGTIETAHLPSYVEVSQCTGDVLNNCKKLSTLYLGNEYARKISETVIGQNDGKDISDVEVEATAAGLFKLLFNAKGTNEYGNGSKFKFTSNSNLNADDLLAMAVSPGKYYVDLFDINGNYKTNPGNDLTNIENVIEAAIDQMRDNTNNTQFRGLLLPNNPYKVGTKLIQDTDGTFATCSEFIGYYFNDAEKEAVTTTMHIYQEGSSTFTHEDRLSKLVSMMNEHKANEDDAQSIIAANTTAYLISTNKPSRISNVSSLLPAGKTIVETINNEMVNPVEGVKPSMYATLYNAGEFRKLIDNTGIEGTPDVEVLQLNGPINYQDINAVNEFREVETYNQDGTPSTYKTPSGPSVLDMKYANVSNDFTLNQLLVGVEDNENLNGVSNTAIEYIILPGGMSKDEVNDVGGLRSKLNSLKAVISATENKVEGVASNNNLVAYVNEAGSLTKGRGYATGASGSQNTKTGLTAVTLSGELNLSDIGTNDNQALYDEMPTITTIDLEYAVFKDNEGNIDSNVMNFMAAGFNGEECVLENVILPTNQYMDEISKDCFHNMQSLKSLCIPFNYKVIHNGALNETSISHLTTTDDYGGAVVDNGPLTYTLSANLERLGDDPSGGDINNRVDANANTIKGVTEPVFPKEQGVLEIYSLATKVPKCYKGVFDIGLSTGYGGQDETKVYCRERYYNNGDANKAFMILHIPNEESFNRAQNADATNAEGDYSTMVGYYTDDTKVFSKLDQTGAVDANGKPMRWPMHNEMLRVYNQANAGLVWKDWTVGDGKDQNGLKVLYGPSPGELSYNAESDFYDYIGWHQIVLTQATYVDPVETSTRNYVKSGWYTFCIPYNLTYSQVVRMLGVPKSSGKVKSFLIENGVSSEVTEDDLMPDIRQLAGVVRTKGVGGADNTIHFRLTGNLLTKNEGNLNACYLDFEDGTPKTCTANEKGEEDPTCLVGGRPYIIRAYKRAYKQEDGSYKEETIPSQNIGKFILTRFADEFEESASCVNNDGTCEQLKSYEYTLSGNQYSIDEIKNSQELITMKFAKPYENHKVQAVNGAEGAGGLTFSEDGKHYKRYYYTMIGQFWEQALPQYSLYMSKGRWYRYTNTANNFKWAPYKCVIMATPEVDEEAIAQFADDDLPEAEEYMDAIWKPSDPSTETKPTMPKIRKADVNPGGGFRDIKNCFFPMNMPDTKDMIPRPLKLTFKGRDDHDFDTPGHHHIGFPVTGGNTRYVFMLDGDDEVVEYDENGNEVTAIATLDGVPQNNVGTTKVYNLSGQYVGSTTEGLSKGVYIVGGRKVVVE